MRLNSESKGKKKKKHLFLLKGNIRYTQKKSCLYSEWVSKALKNMLAISFEHFIQGGT